MSKDDCVSVDPGTTSTSAVYWPTPSCPDLLHVVWWTDELFNWEASLDPEDEDQAASRRLGEWYAALSGTIIGYDAGE